MRSHLVLKDGDIDRQTDDTALTTREIQQPDNGITDGSRSWS
jgi:hypothetical protein